MRRDLLRSIAIILLWTVTAFCQPAPLWVRAFDTAGNSDGFEDVYTISNNGYVFCGYSNNQPWAVRTDNGGDVIWSRLYPEDNDGGGEARSIIETDEGNFLIGGVHNNSIFAFLIDGDGETIWQRTYGQGSCDAVIELKEGNYALCGKSGENENSRGYVSTISPDDGEVIWATHIQHGIRLAKFTAMRETDGGIVTTGTYRPPDSGTQGWMAKIDFNGDVIWTRDFIEEEGGLKIRAIVSAPEGGFALTGYILTRNVFRSMQHAFLMKVNDRGFLQNMYRYDPGYPTPVFARSLIVVPDVGFMLVGKHLGRDATRSIAISTTSQGALRWQTIHNFEEMNIGSTELMSVVIGHDGGIIAAGKGYHIDEQDNRNLDGIAIKLEPDQLEPVIFYWSPEDTVFIALRGDTTEFIVRARDQQGDEFTYMWIMGEDTLGHDSTVTKFWEEVGEYIVQCQASDGENISSINWHVNVTDFYINSHQPDSLNPSTRRNSTIDFSVTTRAIEDDPIEYVWLLNDEQIAANDSVTIRFERGREHSVTAIASQGELADSVTWQVMVNDLIVDYMPEQLDLSVRVDTSFEFEVFPFDPEDDSLHFLWTLNGDSISDNSWVLVNFDEEGLHQVTAFVSDTTESDSLTWTVDVTTVGVHSDEPQHPDTPTLYPPVPNPFNSVTTVRYYLPIVSKVRLNLFDVNGRLIAELVDGYRIRGQHSVGVDGSDLVSGVYFVRMETNEKVLAQKILLIR